MYEVCPEGIQPCNMKKETFIAEDTDTRNILHRTMTSQSPSKWTSHSSPSRHQLPHCIFLKLIISLFPFKGDFSFGKSQKCQGTKSGQ